MMKGECYIRRMSGVILMLTLACSSRGETEVDVSHLPPAVDRPVDFDLDVKPIFEQSCLQCHGPERPKSRFRLDNREFALKGGLNFTNAIVPGDSANSALILIVADLDPDILMPPPNRFDPLTSEQIGILRAWIDQGANWSANFEAPQLDISFVPTLRWVNVKGNSARFREIEGVQDELSGGIGRFEHREQVSQDTTLAVDGHAIFPDESYRLTLALEKRETGFIRAGFESWREYYDDVGGYAPLLPTNFFALNRDLYLDVGRAWIDLGLTLPDWPEVVLGYEYQFRNGEKSTLQWGAVGTQPPFALGTDAKHVYPAFKAIDEETHILKLDIRHELRGWQLEDNARIEFHEMTTDRRNVFQDTFGQTPDSVVLVREKYQHVSGANTLGATKQVREWLSVSSGYLYSRLDGDASLDLQTVDGTGSPVFGDQWQAGRIDIRRESHVLSLASVAGPWSSWVFSLGAQGEWTQQESVGNEDLRIGDPSIPILFSDASPIRGNLDSRNVRENMVIRWSGIPFTIVSAEARLRQEDLGRFEERTMGFDPFTRQTDADIQEGTYRFGFTTSPWSRLSFAANAKHREKQTDYQHNQLVHPSGYLYPAFIQWREIEDNQVELRMTYRASAWFRTTLNYRWVQSDFDNATAAVPFASSGGPVQAAKHEAHVYAVSAVLTPLPQLFLSGTFSYSDSRTATAQNEADYLVPWKGDVFSVGSSVTYAVTPKLSLRGSYSFARSDYGQNNTATGLPAGVDYDRHALQFSVNHEFPGHLIASAGYAYYDYREPTLGGAADYQAHAVFASATFPLP